MFAVTNVASSLLSLRNFKYISNDDLFNRVMIRKSILIVFSFSDTETLYYVVQELTRVDITAARQNACTRLPGTQDFSPPDGRSYCTIHL